MKCDFIKNKSNNIKTIEFNKKLHKLYLESEHLRKIRKITSECLSNGAYGERNMEIQEVHFQKNHVPEWEREIIRKAWGYKKKKAHKLLKDLEGLIDGEEI